MEYFIGFIIGVIWHPLIMKIIIVYKNRNAHLIPRKDIGFRFNVMANKTE